MKNHKKETQRARLIMLALTGALLTLNVLSAKCQAVQRDQNGNFKALTTKETTAHDSTTAYTYTAKDGTVEAVYQGKNGGYYLVRVSKKSGKFYRKYLPKTEE